MKRNSAGRSALAVTILLGLPAAPAEGLPVPGQTPPAIQLTVAADARSEKLVCTVTQTLPPSGKGRVMLGIRVPHESTLQSARLKTSSGQLALDPATTTGWAGLYTFVIASEEVDCAPSGTLTLVVEGEFGASTVGCPEIPLFKAGACDESPSGKK